MRSEAMTHTLRGSRSLYSVLLFAYPSDFRRHFGSEMKDAFTHQIASEWKRHGVTGGLAVWRLALWELFSVAIPLQLQNRFVVATGLSLLGSFSLFALMAHAVAPHCNK
jgi:hypothetical protein